VQSPPLRLPPRGSSATTHIILCQACLLVVSLSCSHEKAILGPPPPPPLETVAFDAIGSGKVLFLRSGATYGAAYLIDADSRTVTVLPDTGPGMGGPSLAPAGDRIAGLAWTDYTTCYDVYVSDLSGGHRARASDFACNSEDTPSWTPDGTGVVFMVDYIYGDPDAWGIHKRTLSSGMLTKLRAFAPDTGGYFRCPSAMRWLPDGPVSVSSRDGLAYVCGREIDVAVDAADSLRARYRIADTSWTELYSATWSPDGDRVAFLELQRRPDRTVVSTALKILEPGSDTARVVAVVNGSSQFAWWGENLLAVCWLPGGSKLVFNAPSAGQAADASGWGHLYVVGADGNGLVQLTTAAETFDSGVSCSR